MPIIAPGADRDGTEYCDVRFPESFPRDLADWIGAASLEAIALQLAQRGSNRVVPVFSFDADRMTNPWRLLALLLYCGARGLCTAAEIRAFARRDGSARDICRSSVPGVDLIARFQRQNAAVLLLRLEELFATAFLHAPGKERFARCLEVYVTGRARAEAERRLRLGSVEPHGK